MADNPLFQALLPEVELRGKGTVTPPGVGGDPLLRMEAPVNPNDSKERERRYKVHYEEFRSRGISVAESERLAKAVLARDEEGGDPRTPLKLSVAEAKRLKIEQP